MEDAKVFGSFSILIGILIIILSSFLNMMPLFLVIGILTGAGILLSGSLILLRHLCGRSCPICGELIRNENRECAICGYQLPDDMAFSLLHRLIRRPMD
ncbi:MAG: hypothetical protein GXO69_07355 [Acidobacteria bacterium]|nr:hypothetical protein [Acidobacteriota bacterium]